MMRRSAARALAESGERRKRERKRKRMKKRKRKRKRRGETPIKPVPLHFKGGIMKRRFWVGQKPRRRFSCNSHYRLMTVSHIS